MAGLSHSRRDHKPFGPQGLAREPRLQEKQQEQNQSVRGAGGGSLPPPPGLRQRPAASGDRAGDPVLKTHSRFKQRPATGKTGCKNHPVSLGTRT